MSGTEIIPGTDIALEHTDHQVILSRPEHDLSIIDRRIAPWTIDRLVGPFLDDPTRLLKLIHPLIRHKMILDTLALTLTNRTRRIRRDLLPVRMKRLQPLIDRILSAC